MNINNPTIDSPFTLRSLIQNTMKKQLTFKQTKPEPTISIPFSEVSILWQFSPFACLSLELTEGLLAVVHDLRNLAVQLFAS